MKNDWRIRRGSSKSVGVRDWCKSLGCTEEELRKAVAAVGDSATKVRDYLKSRE